MDSAMPPIMPRDDERELRRRILIIGIVMSALLLAGYGYAKYISYQSYQQSSVTAEKAQQDIQALEEKRAANAEGKFCGGIATGAFPCPTGYTCKLDGDYPDAGGKCIRSSTAGILIGHVDIGPICPVEQVGHPCTPSPEMYSSIKIIVYLSDEKTLVDQLMLDSQGNFKFGLPPGNYFVDYQKPGDLYAHKPKPVSVKTGQSSTLNFSIDTGIR